MLDAFISGISVWLIEDKKSPQAVKWIGLQTVEDGACSSVIEHWTKHAQNLRCAHQRSKINQVNKENN